MPATVKDIARSAGVSSAAVSKVLHNASTSVRVSPERAQLIRDIAKQMCYVPNANARILRSSRSQTIGIYFEHLAGIGSGPLYTMHLLDGVCQETFKRHYRIALLAELDHADTMGSLADGRLDGVIWCRLVRDEKTMQIIHDCPIPIVALNAPAPSQEADAVFVRCDNAGGMEAAVDHLWDLGHRRILFLRENEENDGSDSNDRLSGFAESMARRGAPIGDEDIAEWSWELAEFSDWWATRPPHTAVIGWSERCAGQLLKVCEEEGVDVPRELSVVGFDSTQYCDSTRPRLTAIRQPIMEMASLAARELLDMIEGKPPKRRSYTLPCPLDIRNSTAPPRS